MHIVKFFQNYFRYCAIQLTSCNVILCVYYLCLINPLNLSNISPAKNSAKVNPTIKINPLLLPPSDRK